MNLRGGHFPDERHTLLLKAALCERLEAIRYFVSWLELNKLDKLKLDSTSFLSDFMDSIDKGSQRMIPLVIHNLGEDTHPYFRFLTGIRKNYWVINKQIAHRAAEMLKLLAQEGVPGMLIKGLDLAEHYYENIGYRSMNNGNILIPYEFKDKAAELLKKGISGKFNSAFKEMTHAMHLEFEGEIRVDIHWNIFEEYVHTPDASDFIWRDATKENANYRMSATHTLFVSMVKGRRFEFTPPFRWVADAKMIIEKSYIDWDEFLTLTKRFYYKPFLKRAFAYLTEHYDLKIPCDFVEKLNSLEVSKQEEAYYFAISASNRKYGFFGLIWFGINRKVIEYNLFLNNSDISLSRYLFSWAFNRMRAKLAK